MSQQRHRIISLLPSATEILFAIGAGEEVVGTTHECDFPPQAELLPNCTSNLMPPNLTASEIDKEVTKTLTNDPHSIYALNEDVIRELQPTVIVTQSLCAVCAVPQSKVESFACTLSRHCLVVAADPHTLVQLFGSMVAIGRAVGHDAHAQAAVKILRQRLVNVCEAGRQARMKTVEKNVPNVMVLEWPDPPYAPGHWVPDQVDGAGGLCAIGASGKPSRRITWEELNECGATVVVCAFCGYDLPENERQVDLIADRPEWSRFIKGKRVYATDGSAFFSRPGNRLVDGTELLAFILYELEQYRPETGCGSLLTANGWKDLATL